MQTTRTSEEIRAWLIERIAAELRVPAAQINTQRPLLEMGLSSIEAASFSGELSTYLGVKISPLVLWDYPTIEQLAQHLGGRGTQQSSL